MTRYEHLTMLASTAYNMVIFTQRRLFDTIETKGWRGLPPKTRDALTEIAHHVLSNGFTPKEIYERYFNNAIDFKDAGLPFTSQLNLFTDYLIALEEYQDTSETNAGREYCPADWGGDGLTNVFDQPSERWETIRDQLMNLEMPEDG